MYLKEETVLLYLIITDLIPTIHVYPGAKSRSAVGQFQDVRQSLHFQEAPPNLQHIIQQQQQHQQLRGAAHALHPDFSAPSAFKPVPHVGQGDIDCSEIQRQIREMDKQREAAEEKLRQLDQLQQQQQQQQIGRQVSQTDLTVLLCMCGKVPSGQLGVIFCPGTTVCQSTFRNPPWKYLRFFKTIRKSYSVIASKCAWQD